LTNFAEPVFQQIWTSAPRHSKPIYVRRTVSELFIRSSLGDDEIDKGIATLRNMQTKAQEDLPIRDLAFPPCRADSSTAYPPLFLVDFPS
jgi:hypothetical protein